MSTFLRFLLKLFLGPKDPEARSRPVVIPGVGGRTRSLLSRVLFYKEKLPKLSIASWEVYAQVTNC